MRVYWEGRLVLEDITIGDESKNETASICLLNYFSMLGRNNGADEFDYAFVDALCHKAGN